MGKWKLVESDKNGLGIWFTANEDGRIDFNISGEKSVAEQIVREHNAHEALVELIRGHIKLLALLRDDLRNETGDYYDPNPYEENRLKAEAVLALAEGRE